MKQNNAYIFLVIFLLAFLSANLSEPKYLNSAIGNLNSKAAMSLPYFPEIPFKLGLDLQGGIHLLYEADLSNVEKDDYGSAMQGLRDVIERRVNLFGVKEPVVQLQEGQDSRRLVVELAGIKDPAEAIKMIGETPFLEFREQRSQEETDKISAKQKEFEGKQMEEIQQIDGWEIVLEDPYFKPTELTGKYLKRAEVGFDQTTAYQALVHIQFNDEGSEIFKELTERNVGKPLAIYIDYALISAPVVQEAISGGKAQISGKFTVEEAKELARNLNAGALPVPITLVSQQNVGPTLGAVSVNESFKAGVIGLAAVILYIILFYRLSGIVASLSLLIYVFLLLSIFKLVPVTLTLAGIGGFILSVGMAVDANVLIFSRFKEELALKKNFSISLEEGFRRAWPSIRDGNLTTLLVAVILFSFGTSFVQGFAFTLSIGILTSIFSAIFITKFFLKCFMGTRFEKIQWLWR